MLDFGDEFTPVKVNIHQFYGIEINDFAVSVAKTALWIAEYQMLEETQSIVNRSLDFLPLKSYSNIVEGNALRIDWKEVIAPEKLNYIMGNPPFIGASMMTAIQKNEAVNIYGKIKLSNSIDYVGAWYFKASQILCDTQIKCAFVSTNSITQGEQVSALWKPLYDRYNIHIDFAWSTFKWDSESIGKAAVHVVIISFSCTQNNLFKLYNSNNSYSICQNITPYLIDAPLVFIESKSKPICNVPKMCLGNKPADGGNLILTEDDVKNILDKEPNLKKYIYQYLGATEYINKKIRYCFWLKDITPQEIRKSNELTKRLHAVKEMRENSSAKPTREKANQPHLFFFISQPKNNYILVPSTSSENRKYIPIGFVPPEIIASNSATIIPDGDIYNFGVLTSNVHMEWMRTVAGRLEMRYRYSNSIVYNNFPWCTPTEQQKAKIEKTAQAILNARALYPNSSLADLYDELTMPPELRKAHQANDKAVMEAYGFIKKVDGKATWYSPSECVSALMKMYQELTSKENK